MKAFQTTVMGLLALGALALAPTAAGADGAARGKAAPTCCNPWSGFYVGGHLGYVFDTDVFVRDVDNYNGPAGSFGHDVDGGMAGVQIGYNLQMQKFVAGIEVDFGKIWFDDDGTQFPAYVGVRTQYDSRANISTNYYAAVTGRLGYLVRDNVLLYGKAGWGRVNTGVSFIDPDPVGLTLVRGTGAREDLDGLVWGGGVEFAAGKYVTFKVEYLRFDVDDTITHRATTNLLSDRRFSHTVSDIDTVRVGFNFRLDRCCDERPMK
jgi:outer membrane immunogenic protein